MQAEQFLRRVRVRAGLANDEEARRATDAVFDTLRARISHRGGDNVAEQLPLELRRLWESGKLDHILRSIAGVERMDLSAFLARVARQLGAAELDRAETVTRAVFATLQEAVSEGALHAIEHQLPVDILQFWQDSSGEPLSALEPVDEAEGPGNATTYRGDVDLTHEIWEMLDESDDIDSSDIDVSVSAGDVTLRGTVSSRYEREAAGRIASSAPGTGEVQNDLAVEEDEE